MTEDEFLKLFNDSYDRYMNTMTTEPIKVEGKHNWIEPSITFIIGVVLGMILMYVVKL